jgi:hypothetical protein
MPQLITIFCATALTILSCIVYTPFWVVVPDLPVGSGTYTSIELLRRRNYIIVAGRFCKNINFVSYTWYIYIHTYLQDGIIRSFRSSSRSKHISNRKGENQSCQRSEHTVYVQIVYPTFFDLIVYPMQKHLLYRVILSR